VGVGLERGLTHVLAPIAATVIIAATIAFLVTGRADASRADIPVLYQVPDFTFVERSGKPFGLNDMKGKISVVDFFFASCQGPCPIMNADMAEMYRLYAHSDKVQFVSFTVDPDVDSLPVLKKYAERFGVTDNRWLLVRAESKVISGFCEQGFKVSGELPGRHSTKLILVDPQGMIRGYYDYDSETSLKLLRNNIRTLAREME
ncbi:MAG TPA: SCO family protein, partial [Candidatus Acidoferrum sp.]|nr:SCO family protein [Candidatus Acidoferrum sp.]